MLEATELIDIVDENDKVINQATRGEIYAKGLLHRSVNIVILNSQKQIFLQQRSSTKGTFPLYWDISAAEHVQAGESYDQAANRGLKEELGINTNLDVIRGLHLQKNIFKNSQGEELIENELVILYQGVYDSVIELDPEEVNQGKFFSFDEVMEMIASPENHFTPWFLDEWNFLKTRNDLLI